MSLYHVQFDGGFRHVEADDFGEALRLWNEAMVAEFGSGDSGWTGEDQPESMVLLDESPVIRHKWAGLELSTIPAEVVDHPPEPTP